MTLAATIAPKPRWTPSKASRRSTLPERLICKTTEAQDLLGGKQTFNDAVAAGWLKPCCEKANKRDVPTKFYAVADVQDVARRMLLGEYPKPEEAA